jgi:tetratricopeptide (TPR) repeat protein
MALRLPAILNLKMLTNFPDRRIMAQQENARDGAIREQIAELYHVGDEYLDGGEFEKAEAHYRQAWALLPEPKIEHEESTWIQAGIGEALFGQRKYDAAWEAFRIVFRCPEAVGNPYLHLRRGQIAFMRGDTDSAGQELTLAYMGGGRELFQGEDPRYFNYLKTILQPPVGEKEL